MAIIVKPHGDFEPNTIAESAKVNDQINTLYADHNGGLLDANLAPGANIQQAKIHNLTSDFAAINANIGILGNNLGVTLSTVSTDVGEPSSATVGEAQLYVPIFIVANALGTDNYLCLSQDFVLFILNGSHCELRYYYGGSLIFDPIITNISGITQSAISVHVDLTLRARGSAVTQYGIGRCFLQTNDDNFYVASGANLGRGHFLSATIITVDSTVDQNIQINAIWDQPGNAITGVGSSCWMVK